MWCVAAAPTPLLFLVAPAALLGLALGAGPNVQRWILLALSLGSLAAAVCLGTRLAPFLLMLAALLVGTARAHPALQAELPRVDEALLAELCLNENSLSGGPQMLAATVLGVFANEPHNGQPSILWRGRLPVSMWASWTLDQEAIAHRGDCWLFRGRLRQSQRGGPSHLFFAQGRGQLLSRDSGLFRRFEALAVERLRCWRAAVRRGLDQHAPADQHSLFMALVLGDRSLLDDRMREAFVRTGTAHLLAISGLHVGMLGLWILAAARLVCDRVLVVCARPAAAAGYGATLALLPSLIGATGYVLISGCPVSARRALAMFVAMTLAVILKRPAAAGHALLLAALSIVWISPPSLMDTGLHLSVVAVAGLLLLARVTRKVGLLRHRWLGPPLLLTVASTVAAVATAPICLWSFGRASIAGLWVNPIVVPLLGSMTLPPLLLGAALSPTLPRIGSLLLQLAAVPARLGTALVEHAARPSWCPMLVSSLAGLEVLLIYAALAAVVALFWLRGGSR